MLKIIKIAIITIVALCVSCVYSNAKAVKTDIKGKVYEKVSGQPLAFATITVLNGEHKIVTGATSKENGDFTFTTLVDGYYKMIISFIGYKNLEIPLTVNSSKSIDLGRVEIEQDSQQLTATVITAKVPLIEQKLDKVVMNVSESVMAQTNNGFEILRKAPGISVDTDGNILLNGQAVEVWIDNRPSRLNGSQLETLLSAIDGSTVEKIEIMQHPSAKFDAAGSGGIINIRTKKNFVKGLYGNVSLNYNMFTQNEFHQGANGSINLNYRSKKANTYLTYTPRFYQNKYTLSSTTLFGENYKSTQISESLMGGDNSKHYAKLGSDFYLSDKNTIGFLAATTISRGEFNSFYSRAETFTNSILTERSKSNIEQNDDMNSLDANIYYTRTFSQQSDLTFNVDYNYFDMTNTSIQQNKYYNPNDLKYASSFTNNSKQYINIYSFKADYKVPVWKKGLLEAGLKWARTNTSNNMVRKDSMNTEYIINSNLSSKFNYREDISAAYLSLAYQFNQKWSTKVGLRGEYTRAKGNWISADTVTTQQYLDVFPTVFLGYTPAANWRLSFSYALRVQRPRFSQLNPFRVYADANSYIEGNPNLKPQYTNQLSLNAGYKSFLNFGLIYMRSGSFISQNIKFDHITGEKQILWSNFGTFTAYGINASLSEMPLVKNVLFLNANTMLSNAISKSSSRDYVEKKFFYQVYAGLTTVLPKDFKIELTGNYQSGLPFGYMNIEPIWRMNFGVKKSFWKNKATISLALDDIFGTGNTDVNMYENGINNYNLYQKNDSRTIKIGFNYKFGNVQGKRRTNQRDDTSTRIGSDSGTSTGL
ncbi:MAG: TonB-dependent receptor [Bacteroidales bacterium]